MLSTNVCIALNLALLVFNIIDTRNNSQPFRSHMLRLLMYVQHLIWLMLLFSTKDTQRKQHFRRQELTLLPYSWVCSIPVIFFVGFQKTSSNYQGYRPLMLYMPRMYSLVCFAENRPGAAIIYAFHQLDVLDSVLDNNQTRGYNY